MYGFVGNRPVNAIDPQGNHTVLIIIWIVGGVLFLDYLWDWKKCTDATERWMNAVKLCRDELDRCKCDPVCEIGFLEKYGAVSFSGAIINCAKQKDPAAFPNLVKKCGKASAQGIVNGSFPTL